MGSKPTADVLVRPATYNDIQRLGRLGTLLIEEHHAFDQNRFVAAKERTPEHYAMFLNSRIDDPNAVILVAGDKEEVIGYAYAEIEGDDYMSLRGHAAILHDLIVDPEYRGRGVGTLLLNAMLPELQSRGTPRVILSTAARNKPAQRLFEHMGFRRTMIEMTRELDDASHPNQSAGERSLHD